jgi:SAM-dependent methyltransferase
MAACDARLSSVGYLLRFLAIAIVTTLPTTVESSLVAVLGLQKRVLGQQLPRPTMNTAYNPEFYDIHHSGRVKGDVEWYRNLAMQCGGSVLELGAGTGRVTLELARAGIRVCALDSDAGMLSVLQKKLAKLDDGVQARVSIIESDMRDFATDRRFRLVIAPFRAFLHNLTPSDQANCVRCVAQHLEPGGRFALNVSFPSLSNMASHAGQFEGTWRAGGEWELEDGGFLILSKANRYDTVRQLTHWRLRYERYDCDGKLVSTFLHRLDLSYLYPNNLTRLLTDHGFGEVELLGGFDGRALTSEDDEIIASARLA